MSKKSKKQKKMKLRKGRRSRNLFDNRLALSILIDPSGFTSDEIKRKVLELLPDVNVTVEDVPNPFDVSIEV